MSSDFILFYCWAQNSEKYPRNIFFWADVFNWSPNLFQCIGWMLNNNFLGKKLVYNKRADDITILG